MWQNKYIGIPYKDYGRDNTGIDCWGLACLVYREEFNIDLPSFSEPGIYDADDRNQIAEIIAQNKEGWTEVNTPEAGDLVLFRVMGQPSHVGIAVSTTHFIHAMEGHACTIEAFESINWKHRCIGIYKYTPQANVNNLVAVPHPLHSQKVIMNVAYGSTIQQVYDIVNQQHNISDRLKKHITILKNSMVIPQSEWNTTVVQHGDTLEYRAVPGGDIGRLVLTLLVLYIAVQLGPMFGTQVGSALGLTAAQGAIVVQAGVMMAGTMLINAIMPIRPPAQPEDPGSAKSQLMFNGATNRTDPYGTVPFVLGKMRITPPLGAQNFIRFGELTTGIVDNADKSYLDMLLVWGYGPLNIDETTMRIGDISVYDYSTTPPTPNFEKLKYITLDRKSTETDKQLLEFNAIYGKDVEYKPKGVALTCSGLPPVDSSTGFLGSAPWTPATTPGPYIEQALTNPCDKVSVALHFPQGLRAIITQGRGAGETKPAPVSITIEYRTASMVTWKHWTTEIIGGTLTTGATTYYPAGSMLDSSQYNAETIYWDAYSVTESINLITGGAPRKDAFTWTVTKDRITDGISAWSATEPLQIRIRRNTGDEDEPGSYRYSHTVIFQSVTGISNSEPAVDPKYCKIAKTALTIQATDQLNNQMDGITAVVQTWCLDWTGSAWVEAATSNPASLFRYVLQSAANPQRILDADVASKIDLTQLQYWHSFCNQTRTDPETGETYKFEFNDVIASQRSVLDILRDICAAGKASPALIDGRWTVVIDEPRTQVIQHFSPHNSWGFESTKMLPKFPDALKVQYYDQDYDYQQRELIIPFAGKTVATSELFETIQLPGVTKKAIAKDHARWHMAQVKLRPEVYTLNSDIEYLVCNRGDRVKVTHDVPMWGLGSGRIKDVYNNLTTYSEELNTNWTNATGATWQYSSALSPENTLTALGVDGLAGTSISATGTNLYQVVSGLTIGKTYTFSVYIRTKTGTNTSGARLRLNQTGNSVLGTAVAVSETWQRITVTATAVTTSFTCIIGTSGNTNIGNFYIWGAMLNEGSVAQPYVKSTSIKGCSLLLDETIPMKANSYYTIRIRSNAGASTTRDIVPKTLDNYYNIINITSPVTVSEAAAGDLFLFGELNQESQDLLVLNIEPGANKTARLTLVDYGVTTTYNIFTDYLSLSNSTIFESQVTIPPKLLINSFGTKVPTISGMVSDETVMELLSPGVFAYKLLVSFTNADDLPENTEIVQTQIDYNTATDDIGIRTQSIEYTKGSILLGDVEESIVYRVRLRYVGSDGRSGNWTNWTTHTIVGKTNPPSSITGATYTILQNSGKINLTWNNNPELDIKGYEIRETDFDWGSTTNYLYNGSNTTVDLDFNKQLSTFTWYIKAYDYNNNYSTTATAVGLTILKPTAVTASSITAVMGINNSSTIVTLAWTKVTPTSFAIAGYKIVYGAKEVFVNANTLTVTVDWLGAKQFNITAIDIVGAESTISSKTVTKLVPAPVTGFSYTINENSGKLVLDWDNNSEVDIKGYEVRYTDSNWGADNQYVYKGANSVVEVDPRIAYTDTSWYIKAYDYNNNYSATSLSANLAIQKPGKINAALTTYNFADTSLTSATVTISWPQATQTLFSLEGYKVKYDDKEIFINATSITLAADWVGTRNISITTVDIVGLESEVAVISIPKQAPNPILQTSIKAQVIDNSVLLSWTLPDKTTLPISHTIIRKSKKSSGVTSYSWATAEIVGEKSGTFTSFSELSKGEYIYWLRTVDTDGIESTDSSVTVIVSQPPDYIFNAIFTSTFSGTKVNAAINTTTNTLVLPVNTTETFQQHFVNNSFTTPQAQITAGYPYYLQPGTATASYTEIFDYQTLLASSQIALEATANTIAGSGSINYYLSYSANGTTYSTRQLTSSLYASNFRYIKLEVEVTEYTADTLFEIKALSIRLDSKKITDGGNISALSTDTNGTIVNFAKEFVDVDSISVAANGTTPLNCVYNFKDTIQTSTYSLVSNVCTITTGTAHGLVAGQNVRLTFSSGTATNGVYTITSVPSTTTLTVSITTANSSGNLYLYPNSFTVYVFDNTGVRQAKTVSWQIQGF